MQAIFMNCPEVTAIVTVFAPDEPNVVVYAATFSVWEV